MEAKRKTHTVHLTDADVSDVLWAIENHLDYLDADNRFLSDREAAAATNLAAILLRLEGIVSNRKS